MCAWNIDITDQKSVEKISEKKLRIYEAVLKTYRMKSLCNIKAHEIASSAGIKKPTLFYHFDSLEELYESMFRYYHQILTWDMHDGVKDVKGTKNKLRYLWFKRARWAIANPDEMRYIFYFYAIEKYRSLEIDKALIKIISDGRRSRVLMHYDVVQITGLFYASSNSLLLSIINLNDNYYHKRKITMVRLGFENLFNTIAKPDSFNSKTVNTIEPNEESEYYESIRTNYEGMDDKPERPKSIENDIDEITREIKGKKELGL